MNTCIDVIGVAVDNSVKQWTPGLAAPLTASDPKYFNYVYKPTDTTDIINTLKTATENKSLTWEGITDSNYTKWNTATIPAALPKCTP